MGLPDNYRVGHMFPYIEKCIMYIFYVSDNLEDLYLSLGTLEDYGVSGDDTRHKSSQGTNHQRHYKLNFNCVNIFSSIVEKRPLIRFRKKWSSNRARCINKNGHPT